MLPAMVDYHMMCITCTMDECRCSWSLARVGCNTMPATKNDQQRNKTDADYDGPCCSSNDETRIDKHRSTFLFLYRLIRPSDYFTETAQNVPSKEDLPREGKTREENRVTEGRTLLLRV